MSVDEAWARQAQKCYWHYDLICENNFCCGGCEHQPADEDKKNGKAEPLPIEWGYDGYGSYPECPACHDMPYSYDRCVWCGQKLIKDDEAERRSKPPKVEHMDCIMCGGKDTVEYVRSYYNGHRHGHCTACGMKFIE